MTLYLKYRPQLISDLDSVKVREQLHNLLGAKNVPHAFLFSGPRGLGKTSAARILAKAINCPQVKNGEPCNKCEVCVSINLGQAIDVIEIDAASNRGIDEIRSLRDGIKLAPLQFTHKVYIIDEVHMLTTEAANALLKTLEEPPAHVIFILATTDPQKLPETVISRCTRIQFTHPTIEEIVSRLKKDAKAEEMKFEDEALVDIAKSAKGSFRDAVKLLEQTFLTYGKVDLPSTNLVLGNLKNMEPESFLQLWENGETRQALEFVNTLVESGVSIREFIEKCLGLLRLELLEKPSGETISKIDKLDQAYDRSKYSAIPQLPLEILLVESKSEASTKAPNKPSSSNIPEKQPEKSRMTEEKPKVESKFKLDDVVTRWSEVLKAVKPKNHSVEALLRSTSPVEFDGQDLLLEVFYKFHKEKLETDKCRQIVEEAVGDVMRVPKIKLKLKLGSKQKKQELSANVEEDIVKAAAEIFKVDAL